MTTDTLSGMPVKIGFPNLEEIRAMMTDPGVAKFVIVCVTLFASLAVTGVVFLAYTGHDAAIVGTLIGGALLAVGNLWSARMKSTIKDTMNKQDGQ